MLMNLKIKLNCITSNLKNSNIAFIIKVKIIKTPDFAVKISIVIPVENPTLYFIINYHSVFLEFQKITR